MPRGTALILMVQREQTEFYLFFCEATKHAYIKDGRLRNVREWEEETSERRPTLIFTVRDSHFPRRRTELDSFFCESMKNPYI